MATYHNPKTEGSGIVGCKPQIGVCPNNCNQCFYNRVGASYVPPAAENIPTVAEVGSAIVRMNDLHDSNIFPALVKGVAKRYKRVFFNTSIPKFDFDGPVVFTANAKEEEPPIMLEDIPENLMAVRLRVSVTNLPYIQPAVLWYARQNQVPVILTFMAYYSQFPPGTKPGASLQYKKTRVLEHKLPYWNNGQVDYAYIYKRRTSNEYWVIYNKFSNTITEEFKKLYGRVVSQCGGVASHLCMTCRNCETLYWLSIKHLSEIGVIRKEFLWAVSLQQEKNA